MAKLDKSARDALPDNDFAVPGKRKLPMHDEHHVKLAWDMVDRTDGLSPEERSAARSHIMRRAKELGVDTSDWHKIKAMRFDAMALNISNDDDHPNKMPFSGILVRLDEPSDAAPLGSGNRRIIVSAAAAEKALGSILGMSVDYTPFFDGHDAQAKIGLITSANIVGNAIEIAGFVYAADFPQVAASIKNLKSALGFSFEAQRITVADPDADIVTITDLAFTGAAILRKDKAAYTTTSLAAAAAHEEIPMTADEMKALLAEAVAPLASRLEKIEAEATRKVEASKAITDMVEPHAKSMESCAAGMEAAGVGGDPKGGHVAVLRRMAGAMRAEAAMGKVPHIFNDTTWYHAAAEGGKVDAETIKKAVEEATKPLADKLAASETQIADLKAAAKTNVVVPERKTVSPAITSLLAKAGITTPEGDVKMNVADLDKALTTANLSTQQRLQVKTGLTHAGIL